jgi:nitroimidazol reductase NimA-like FMN-containing flavoprotein (pyridoxamine 5'-phosphate oxidase superfamily)
MKQCSCIYNNTSVYLEYCELTESYPSAPKLNVKTNFCWCLVTGKYEVVTNVSEDTIELMGRVTLHDQSE